MQLFSPLSHEKDPEMSDISDLIRVSFQWLDSLRAHTHDQMIG